jgi:hypothetical protein
MNPMTAAKALHVAAGCRLMPSRAVVDALARADRLCPPGTLARLAALEVVVDAARELQKEHPLFFFDTAMERLYQALDALDAAPDEKADPRTQVDSERRT